MVRAFGDVPYYTIAYNSASLPRTNMVTVLQSCLEDLRTGALGNSPEDRFLPWTYNSKCKKRSKSVSWIGHCVDDAYQSLVGSIR